MKQSTWLAMAGAALLAGCGGNQYEAPPPPAVTVAKPVERAVTTYGDFSGHTVSVEAVDVRARVQGYLKSMHFKPGTEVQKGALLFVIEPDLYRARVERAEADLARAEAQARAAGEQLAITQAIFQRNAGSKTDLVQKTQARDEAQAEVARARADLAAARLDLSYTQIYAPISGQIDRNYVDIGNLVGSGEANVLTSIVRERPIYAYFDVSERDLLLHPELYKGGAPAEGQPMRVYLGLLDEEGTPRQGVLDYSSNRVDPSTGTFDLRAVFPNTDGRIVPGLFVRLRVPFSEGRSLLVPDDAVLADQGGRYVLVVGDRNVVEQRRVEVGAVVDRLRVIDSGLAASDLVVVDGLQRARPGSTVKPTVTDLAAAGDTPAALTPGASPALPTGAAADAAVTPGGPQAD
jgi:RND family efflux transporter MFP subunit